jgi:hypothetical protein
MPTLHHQRRPTDELICEVGDQVEIAGVFTDDQGLPADPTRVFVSIATPNGSIVLDRYGAPGSVLNKAGVGQYIRQFVPTMAGRHYWRLWGEGVVTRAHVGTLVVLANPTLFETSGAGTSPLPMVTVSAAGTVT